MPAKRNYQTPIFDSFDYTIIDYTIGDDVTKPLKAKISVPRGDTETKRALVLGLPGGGGVFPALDWYAKRFTEVGFVFTEFDPGNGSEYDQIAHGGCFNRFMHKNHNDYGISGSKFFGFGVSLGGSNLWAQNISLLKILTDPRFASPVNALYPKAKMTLKGSASSSGSVTDNIYKYIDASCKEHYDYHGTADTVLPIKKSQDAVDQMNSFGIRSVLTKYEGLGHGLDGQREKIVADILIRFAGLMGIKPVTPIA